MVDVLVERPGGVPEHATGFVAADGRVVTVAHVLDGGGAVSVGGGGAARVLRVDRAADLALLSADAEGDSAGRGVRIVSARDGAARAAPVSVRRRIVARVRDSAGSRVYSRRTLELAGDVAAGDSGAPVLDADGDLLGVVFARSRRHDGTAYAVDASAVDRLLGRRRTAGIEGVGPGREREGGVDLHAIGGSIDSTSAAPADPPPPTQPPLTFVGATPRPEIQQQKAHPKRERDHRGTREQRPQHRIHPAMPPPDPAGQRGRHEDAARATAAAAVPRRPVAQVAAGGLQHGEQRRRAGCRDRHEAEQPRQEPAPPVAPLDLRPPLGAAGVEPDLSVFDGLEIHAPLVLARPRRPFDR